MPRASAMRPAAARAPAALLAANYDVHVGYAWNNIFRLFNALARALHDRGVRVCLSFPALSGAVTFLDPDVSYETLLFDPQRISRASLAAVRPEFLARDIRYVYLTDQRPTHWAYAVLRRWGVRRVVIHNRVSVREPRRPPPARGLRRLAKSLHARVPLMGADRVYAVSDFVRHRLVEANCVPPGRVRTILNGIDVDAWRCPPADAARTPVTVFCGARAARYKGVLVLIEAVALARRRGADIQVRYAGDGPDLELFRTEASRLGVGDAVMFLGPLSGTRSEVCAADVVAVPSMYGDACPSTVSEALASGRPLVTTRAGGIPELVGDPANAVLVEPGDVEGLAAALIDLAHHPQKRADIGARGRRRAEQALREEAYHRAVVQALLADFGLAEGSTHE